MRVYHLGAVAVGRPERGGVRAEEVSQPSQQPVIIAIPA
jgi:hypothetical protein